jgi:hypothetical protein
MSGSGTSREVRERSLELQAQISPTKNIKR